MEHVLQALGLIFHAVKARIQQHIETLLMNDGLPIDVMKRGDRFLQQGDLHQLMDLPLLPDEMIEVGTVLLQAPTSMLSTSRDPAPTLSVPVRRKLHALVDAAEVYTEAALFVLSRDLSARALNRLLDEQEP